MPIGGTSSVHQDVEEARKRVKLESGVFAPAPAPNSSDLTNLLKDLDDAGEWAQTDGDMEAMVHGDREAMMQAQSPLPETITKALELSSEHTQMDGDREAMVHGDREAMVHGDREAMVHGDREAMVLGDREAMVQAQSPLPETITKALELSSEHTQMDGDIECMVLSHDAIRKEWPSAEIVILDSDSDDDEDDDDLIMFDHLGDISLWKNVVKSEPGTGKVEMNISQLEGAVKIEPECLRLPEESYQLGNAVKVEPEIRTLPDNSHQLENAVKVEPEFQIHPDKRYQWENAVKIEPGNFIQPEKSSELVPNEMSGLVPSYSSHVVNGVNLEFGGIRQAPVSMESRAFEASTMLGMHREGQEQMGVMLQTVMKDGRLMWAVVPPNTASLGSPYSVSLLQSRLLQANSLPSGLPNGLGCSSNFTPKIEQESFSSGVHAGPGLGSIPVTSYADMPFYTEHMQPWGMENGNYAIGDKAVVSVPSPFQPAVNVQEAAASGEQAGPSHRWTPPISSGVVPYDYGSTVSSSREDVARTMNRFTACHNKALKAKDDRHQLFLAVQSKTSSGEIVKALNRRGLHSRPDIVAYNDIKKAKLDVNPGVNVGDLPGIEVGDTFIYRHQMALVGVHRLPNVGIDYGYLSPDRIPTATAVVMVPKGGYADDEDYGNTIIYTGQGGRKTGCDQELKRGNLALSTNFERKLPVRVIRGHTENRHCSPTRYSYDGLYSILSYDFSEGINGAKVYKFHMERLEDQPPIPFCIRGCTAHPWNSQRETSEREILAPTPLQAMDPTMDAKPNLYIRQ